MEFIRVIRCEWSDVYLVDFAGFNELFESLPCLINNILIIGVFGTMGSIFKGFNQSIKMNLIQLFLLLSGLIAALVITFSSNPNNKTAQELWDLGRVFLNRI